MSYEPTTDFLALFRQLAGSVEPVRMPGLDYVVATLARANLFRLYVGQTAPIVNQATTVWLNASQPSWVAEGNVFLWNSDLGVYQPATPALWARLLFPSTSGYLFQSLGGSAGVILPGVSLLAVDRVAPTATALTLPNLTAQFATGRKLQIVDFSDSVNEHVMTLSTTDGATIMKSATWRMYSNAAQLATLTLQPSPELNAWITS